MKSDKFIFSKRWILIGVGITVVVALILVAFFGLRPKLPAEEPQDTGQTTTATGSQNSADGTTTAPDDPTQGGEERPSQDGEDDPTQGGEEQPTQGDDDPDGTTPTTKPPQNGSTQQGGSTDANDPISQGLKVERIATYSGKFVEDGSDRPVENVAALLVTNVTDQFLDIANITYDLDGKTATFIVTGLPAGGSAWVLEYQGMTMTKENSLRYVGCVPSFRNSVKESATEVALKVEGNHIQATNTTGDTL